jgi:hypothetical protein
MSVTFQSIRFGTVEIAAEDVIEFPFGLIGLGGLQYTLLATPAADSSGCTPSRTPPWHCPW